MRVLSSDALTDSYKILYQGIADSIAWQLVGQQLCYARRLYRGHRQPGLDNCNLESAIAAADHHVTKNPGSVALISDLTSFVQIGDLLTLSSQGRLGIIEVKGGEKNRKISDFIDFYSKYRCDRAFYYFAQEEGKESVKQMGRMIRQAQRMSYVREVMSKGIAEDPDTKEKIMIPDEFVAVETWEEDLLSMVNEANDKNWAINMVDNCLFLGCYAGGPMKAAGHVAFNYWFDNCGGTPECPRATILDSMVHPLAMPVFNLNLPTELKFDVLFGRKQICVGFNIEAFLAQCAKAGLSVRFATNKETNKADQTGNRPYRHHGKAIFIGSDNGEILLMDGIFLRVLHHMQRPISLMKAILANANLESPNTRSDHDRA